MLSISAAEFEAEDVRALLAIHLAGMQEKIYLNSNAYSANYHLCEPKT